MQIWKARSNEDQIYIGDPCYAMKDEVYDGCWCDKNGAKDGEFSFGGVSFAIGGTAYGDGDYQGSNGFSFPVDAGCIGAIPIELCDPEKVKEVMAQKLGVVIAAPYVELHYDEPGEFYFMIDYGNGDKGEIDISTREPAEDDYEEESYEEDEPEEDDELDESSVSNAHRMFESAFRGVYRHGSGK